MGVQGQNFESTEYSTMTAQGTLLCLQHRVAPTALRLSEASGVRNGTSLRRTRVLNIQMHLKGNCNVHISVNLTFHFVSVDESCD